MRLVSKNDSAYIVELSQEELELVNDALNEVCNGIHIEDWEFPIRLGVERATAQKLLTQVHGLFGKSQS